MIRAQSHSLTCTSSTSTSCPGSHARQPFVSVPWRQPTTKYTSAKSRKWFVRCVTAPYKPKLSYVGIGHTAWAADGMASAIDSWAPIREERIPVPPITKSDANFLKEHLEFVWGSDDIDLSELNTLFELVGFPKRDLIKMKTALDNTHAIVWVRSTKQSRWAKLGQLLGFARATSDKALSATVWDVAVHPAWQRGGLGRGLVERLTASLLEDDIQTICLYAEPGVVGMYEKLGFVKDPQGVKGMAFQRRSEAGQALLASTATAVAA